MPARLPVRKTFKEISGDPVAYALSYRQMRLGGITRGELFDQ
jgi:hypothetical protein